MKIQLNKRHILLSIGLAMVWLTLSIPSWGAFYAYRIYPFVGRLLSGFSNLFPFAIGDLFVIISIVGLLLLLGKIIFTKGKGKGAALLSILEYLAWVYLWFYLAWGLNYSQPSFYQRTGITPQAFNEGEFKTFAKRFIEQLNNDYIEIDTLTEEEKSRITQEVVSGYQAIASQQGIHAPFHLRPRVKTMLYTPLASKVGVSGSMMPFFCEFTLNGDVPASQYGATYAHELSHQQGITNEAEANFYAYQVCTRSPWQPLRFSGRLAILPHLLSNAKEMLSDDDYQALLSAIRPEVIEQYQHNRAYWLGLYSPLMGKVQDWIYDLYLKGNKISSGRKNYSEVIGLLISWEGNKL
ncbi:MAG: DUF3810 domain-containing protein [Bacteroides sp.]|nr:DUF3810 domain-containing protein [Bacteroides sp.]